MPSLLKRAKNTTGNNVKMVNQFTMKDDTIEDHGDTRCTIIVSCDTGHKIRTELKRNLLSAKNNYIQSFNTAQKKLEGVVNQDNVDFYVIDEIKKHINNQKVEIIEAYEEYSKSLKDSKKSFKYIKGDNYKDEKNNNDDVYDYVYDCLAFKVNAYAEDGYYSPLVKARILSIDPANKTLEVWIYPYKTKSTDARVTAKITRDGNSALDTAASSRKGFTKMFSSKVKDKTKVTMSKEEKKAAEIEEKENDKKYGNDLYYLENKRHRKNQNKERVIDTSTYLVFNEGYQETHYFKEFCIGGIQTLKSGDCGEKFEELDKEVDLSHDNGSNVELDQ
jgi:hypothetical protein